MMERRCYALTVTLIRQFEDKTSQERKIHDFTAREIDLLSLDPFCILSFSFHTVLPLVTAAFTFFACETCSSCVGWC